MDTESIDVAGPQLAQVVVPNDSLGTDGAEDYPRTIRGTPKNMILSTMALFLQGKCTLSVGQLRDRLFEVPTGNET